MSTTQASNEVVRQHQETVIVHSLCEAGFELQSAADLFFEIGDDALADEANILCQKITDLLNAAKP